MTQAAPSFRITASTGIHRGDRAYQQDQVEIMVHPRIPGCVLAVLADGMGGKSGGRKAADQVLLTARQLFDRFVPEHEAPRDLLAQIAMEAHLMIRLTAISAEEEPHSTIACYLVMPDLSCHWLHNGDSRIYLFRGPNMVTRTKDHSYVQRLVDEGQLTESEALVHPQSNLLTGCLGTLNDPIPTLDQVGPLEIGDCLMVCSDGLWHYFNARELGTVLHSLPPRDAAELLIHKARQRAQGGGDNLSLALVRIEGL